ncbi:transporter substrate-binding domain-containing protein [Chitinivorax sp. B]|uniref:substrate-binding periplasmic protein n=1 Tax=Chitinivorax sp. B TaxID=2502235 RepID=UPI0010F97DD7|nr:transporter substrate-binding domain-containing protein [Chitinivorax sp. B]
MKQSQWMWWNAVLYCMLLGQPLQAQVILKIATGELPPYATKSRPDSGIALNVIRRAFARVGYQVEYHFMPWSRAQAETRIGKWDATAYWGRTSERERDFLLSDNVLTEQWVFLHRRKTPFDWQTLDDLANYQIAVIQDYTYTPDFRARLASRKLHGDATPDDLAALRKLILGRVDIVPMERNVACDLLKRFFREEEADQLAAHPKLMTDRFTTHLMLTRSKPTSTKVLQDFNEGLKQLRDSGEHGGLLQQLSCPLVWSTPSKQVTSSIGP